MNISDYFMYQLKNIPSSIKNKNLWEGVPEDTRQRLRELDTRRSQLLSSATDVPSQGAASVAQVIKPFQANIARLADTVLGTSPAMAAEPMATATTRLTFVPAKWQPGQALRTRDGRGSPNEYVRRLAYLETRIQNVRNAQGSEGQGYFQAFDAFNKEATAASGIPMGARNPNYELAAKATWAWIRRYNKDAAKAIIQGQYDKADRLLRNTWPSLPGGSQAQPLKTQREALRFLSL